VTPFKQTHWKFKNLGFAHSKRKLFAAFRSRTSGIDFIFIGFTGYFPFDYYPCSALGARDTRTDNMV